jgi:hypothetical protein
MAAKLSFIEDNEIEEAKSFIDKHLGFPAPRVAGYHLAVKIYVRPNEMGIIKDENGNPILGEDGKPKRFYIPEVVTANDKWRSCVGLVLSMGPEAYKGDRYKESGAWCRIGDWIAFPRNEGTQINYRGIPMQIIPDDRVLLIAEDPEHVKRD